MDPSAIDPIEVFEPSGAWIRTRTYAALAAALAALFLSLLALGLRWSSSRSAGAAALVGAVAALVAGLVVRSGMTVIPAHEGGPSAVHLSRGFEAHQFRNIGPTPPGTAFGARLENLLRTRYGNSFFGRDIPWGIDVPGGLVVNAVTDGWTVTTYDPATGAESGVYRFRADGSSEDYRPPPSPPKFPQGRR